VRDVVGTLVAVVTTLTLMLRLAPAAAARGAITGGIELSVARRRMLWASAALAATAAVLLLVAAAGHAGAPGGGYLCCV
jgi:hypothetical protein